MSIWYKAISRASGCTHKRHRTGCVIFDSNNHISAAGTAHPTEGDYAIRSIHAERDALRKFRGGDNHSILVVTLTKVGNFASVSRPCTDCATTLCEFPEITKVIYAERANDDSWVVRKEHPINLLTLPLCETRYS